MNERQKRITQLAEWFKHEILDNPEKMKSLALTSCTYSRAFLTLQYQKYPLGIGVTAYWEAIQNEARKRWMVSKKTARDYGSVVVNTYANLLAKQVITIRNASGSKDPSWL